MPIKSSVTCLTSFNELMLALGQIARSDNSQCHVNSLNLKLLKASRHFKPSTV